MEERKIIVYTNHLIEDFQSHFRFTQERQGEEDIHQLRLSVKRLKIFFELIEFASEGAFLKKDHSQLLKPVFKKAGEYRELQVNQNLVANEDAVIFFPYKDYLQKEQQLVSVELLKHMQDFDHDLLKSLNNKLRHNIQTLTDKELLTASSNFILKKWEKIQDLIAYMEDGDKLHKIRINLRGIHELIVMLNFIAPTQELPDLQVEIKSLNNLIGEWHDYYVLSHSINNFISLNGNKIQNPELKNFTQKNTQTNKSRVSEIQHLLNNYIADDKLAVVKTETEHLKAHLVK